MTSRLVRTLYLFVLALVLGAATGAWSQSITTYHYDNFRTGWNSHETVLTPTNVNTSDFGLLYDVTPR